MVENLDYLLTAHHFLDVALGFAESLLLADKEFCRISANGLDDDHHKSDCTEYDQGHPHAQVKHIGDEDNNRQSRLDKRRRCL